MPVFISVMFTSIISSLAHILLKLLTNAVAEENLAKLFFYLADWFAAKTVNHTDDDLVKWAKSVYNDQESLNADKVQAAIPDFISKGN